MRQSARKERPPLRSVSAARAIERGRRERRARRAAEEGCDIVVLLPAGRGVGRRGREEHGGNGGRVRRGRLAQPVVERAVVARGGADEGVQDDDAAGGRGDDGDLEDD